jgi:hypothetical protein
LKADVSYSAIRERHSERATPDRPLQSESILGILRRMQFAALLPAIPDALFPALFATKSSESSLYVSEVIPATTALFGAIAVIDSF